MEATVKAGCPWKIVRALDGNEYVKGEWRRVPAGREAEAGKHPYLDVREAAPIEASAGPDPRTRGPGELEPAAEQPEGFPVTTLIDGERVPVPGDALAQAIEDARLPTKKVAAKKGVAK